VIVQAQTQILLDPRRAQPSNTTMSVRQCMPGNTSPLFVRDSREQVNNICVHTRQSSLHYQPRLLADDVGLDRKAALQYNQ
jgi:hypothetical protein